MEKQSEFFIRRAAPEDNTHIFTLVQELAAYERLSPAVVATPEDLTRALFCPEPKVFCHLAERGGEVIGMAIWFYTFSTFAGAHGIWLEDLFVRETSRRQGVGKALLKQLAAICVNENLARFEWTVLNWNAPSIQFYRSLGAVMMDEWTQCRLEGKALKHLAET